MIKKVCIIGGNGFLGTKYIELINKKNLDIFIFDKKKIKKNNKIKYIYGDCLSINTLKNIPNKIDILIFMVGQVGGPGSMSINNLENYFENNCQTLVNFLENIKKNSIKKIIFFSTEHVYGDNCKNINNHLQTEQQPKNYYGITKLISEKILKNFYNSNKINIDILRFPRVISQGDSSLLTNLIKTVLTKDNYDKPISLNQISEIIKKTFKIKFLVRYTNKSNNLNHNPIELVISNKKFNKNEINWVPSLNNKNIIKNIYLYELKKYS